MCIRDRCFRRSTTKEVGTIDPELARAVIVQHHRTARHRGDCESATAQGTANNPLCGDQVLISLKVVDGVIGCARFVGQGCALSQAGASLVMAAIEGRPTGEAKAGLAGFLQAMAGGDVVEYGDLAALCVVRDNAARATCATLAAVEASRLLADEPDPAKGA